MRPNTHRKRLSSLLSLILALNMVLSLFPVTAFASDAELIEPTEATAESAETEEPEADSEAVPAADEEAAEESFVREVPEDEEAAAPDETVPEPQEEPISPEPEQTEQPDAPAAADTQEAVPEEQPAEQPAEPEEEPEFTVTASGLTEDAVLTVRKLDGSDRDDADQLSALQKQLPEQRIYSVFEIELEEGSIIDTEKGAKVTLKGYDVDDEEHTVLVHFLKDGTTETLDYTFDKHGKEVAFTATSFSPFAFAEKSEVTEPEAEELSVQPRKVSGAAVQTIENLNVQLVSGATKTDDGYVWTAGNSNANHRFTYRVNYAISGQQTLPAGSFVITLPKSILQDRDGNPADSFEIAVPEETAVSDSNKFVYKVDGNQIVIYNRVEISAAEAGNIEFSYLTSKRTTEYVDMQQFAGPEADLTVTNGSTTVTKSTSGPSVAINTAARITAAAKHTPTFYTEWQNSWGEEPTDAGQYYYLVWEISSTVSNGTQPYTFQLDDNFDNEEADLVGYRLQGATEFSHVNTAADQTAVSRYDYVLTRHSKERYSLQNHDAYSREDFTLNNSVTVTVTPKDGVDEASSRTAKQSWVYEEQEYNPPTGNFNLFKYGRYSGGRVANSEQISSYVLTEFKDEENDSYTEISGLRYEVNAVGRPYPWTLEEGASAMDPYAYGKVPVTYVIDDGVDEKTPITLSDLSGNEVKLTEEDYRIDSLSFVYYIYAGDYNETTKTYDSRRLTGSDFKDDDTIIVSAKFGDSAELQEVATLSLKTGAWDVTDSRVSASGDKVTFSGGCTGYQIKMSNPYFYTNFYVYPSLTLFANEKTVGLAENASEIALRNKADLNVYGTENNDQFHWTLKNDVIGTDYISGITRNSSITKTVVKTDNSQAKQQYTITWRVNASESYSDDGGRHSVEQSSGTFYDLLPLGGELDSSTLKVYSGSTQLLPGQYTTEITTNYNDSGRTLLTVRITEPGDSYSITYNSVHSWESIKDYGTQGGTVARNSVAYETGNDDIGNGQPDNGGNITDKDILAGLDGGTTAKKFIYAEQTKTIDILTAASTGLSKMVRATADAQYSYKTITHQSEIYTYRLRMANDNQTSAKDLMFFDSLENYDIGEWKGTLVSVDVAQLREKGVNAKVYYSTIDNLNIENLSVNADYDFVNAKTKSGISIWKTADQIGDLSQVKAIAIDARTATNGSPFTLKANESLSVQVYMKTPATVESEADHPYTFNGIYLYETSISSNGDISDLVEHGYTQVEYRTVGALQIKKVDSTDPSIPVKGVAFTLTGKSHYGTEYDMTVVTNADGIAQFDGLERGEYLIQETEAVDDYLANHVALRVVVDKNGVVTVAGLEQAADGSYIFPNDPRAHGDLVFYKVSTESNAKRIGGVTFKLSGTSSYGNNVLIYATSDSLGKVVLENVELGTYDLTEVEPPEGYITPHHTWKVTCDQNGLLTLAGEDSELVDYTQYVVKNEPYHSFTLRKADIETNEALAGAVFTLKGVSDYETVVDLEVTSGEDGHADFTDLEPGTYILQETVAPENHVLDETQRVVTITRDGTITIEGLEQDETYGFFNYVNEQEFNGTITITKKWVGDEDDPDNRTFPQLVLTTDVELAGYLEATIDATKWQKFKDDNDFITCTSFQPAAKTLTKDEVLDKGAVRIDDGSESSDCPIYAWVEGTDIYWWSEATDAVFLPTHSKNFFASPVWNTSNSLKTVDLRGLSWSKVRDASYMFANCSNLSKLDWNASDIEKGHNLRDMSWMFYKCQTLTSLDMSHFDTSKVTTMGDMFAYCSGLASLDVSHFDTSNVTSMDSMFMHCSSLTSLDVSSFNTSNVESMSSMFAYCSSLIELDLTNFDGKKKCSIKNMFKGCSNLERLDLSGAVMIAGYDSSSAFYGCRNLKVLDLSGFDMRNTLYTNYMFDGCINLETIYVSYSWNREGYGAYWSTGTSWAMFSSCRNLKGGAGSTVNTTSEYAYMSARIDGDGGKGIFTKKEAPTTSNSTTGSNPTEPVTAQVPAAAPAQEPDLTTERMERTFYSTNTFKDPNDPDAENAEGWVDNGDNTWTYTFKVYDDTRLYYIYEKQMDGYNSDTYKTDYQTINGENGSNVKAATITNTKSADTPEPDPGTTTPGYGDLSITKTVLPPAGGRLLDRDREQQFTFTIKLTAPEGASDSAKNAVKAYSTKYGNIDFRYGVATVILTYGQTVIIPNIHEGLNYTITETAVNGYELTASKNAEGDIVKNKTASASFTNTRLPAETGSLSISKTVLAPDGEELTAADNEKQFLFTVTLTAPDSASAYAKEAVVGTQIFGDTVFKNGVGKVSLKNGETVTITDIPEGVTYTVTETEDADYELTDSQGESGTIVKDETAQATFTNTRKPKVEPETNGFTLTKQVEGTVIPGETFTFHVALDNLEAKAAYTYTLNGDETEFTASAIGAADLTLTLADGDSVTFDGLPVGATYQVSEDASGYVASYEVTNSEGEGRISSASAANRRQDQQLTTAAETVDSGEDVTITFINTYTRKDLTVSKTVTGALGDRNKEFEFTLTLTDAIGDPLTGAYAATGKLDSITLEEDGTTTFTLASGESITIVGLPEGAVYTVTEDEDSASGYTTTVSGEETRTVTGILTENEEVSFINDRDWHIPTGVELLSFAGVLAIVAVPVAGLAVLALKRKKRRS